MEKDFIQELGWGKMTAIFYSLKNKEDKQVTVWVTTTIGTIEKSEAKKMVHVNSMLSDLEHIHSNPLTRIVWDWRSGAMQEFIKVLCHNKTSIQDVDNIIKECMDKEIVIEGIDVTDIHDFRKDEYKNFLEMTVESLDLKYNGESPFNEEYRKKNPSELDKKFTDMIKENGLW